MSFYADYIRERTNDGILEMDEGFATYRFLNDGKSVYIVDIYVTPKARKLGAASSMANAITEIAKEKGAIELLGSVQPSSKGSTASLKVLLAYGFELYCAGNDAIVFRKDI